ncbi:hypothetical protein KR038_009099 [Drosophila bunnanda]|nr:hypothetical protein KR038_009099 [Drosophila bunnanda]
MEGRQLTKCVYHSGKCLYQLMACACRNSISKVICLGSVGSGEKFLHGTSGSNNRILLLEKIHPICQERDSWMPHGDIWPCGPSTVLKIEQKILRVTQFIGKLLFPVPPSTLLKILNPFGHSWNMLQDEDSESQDEGLEFCDEGSAAD